MRVFSINTVKTTLNLKNCGNENTCQEIKCIVSQQKSTNLCIFILFGFQKALLLEFNTCLLTTKKNVNSQHTLTNLKGYFAAKQTG